MSVFFSNFRKKMYFDFFESRLKKKATKTLIRKLVYVKMIFWGFSCWIKANVIFLVHFEKNTLKKIEKTRKFFLMIWSVVHVVITPGHFGAFIMPLRPHKASDQYLLKGLGAFWQISTFSIFFLLTENFLPLQNCRIQTFSKESCHFGAHFFYS